MSGIASKNLYELLGNDHEYDSDKEPEPPVKVVDKTPARNTKRNATGEAPAAKAPVADGRGARRGGYSGNEGAFRDRNAGSANNQGKPTDDSVRQDRHPRREGGGRGRGGARGGAKFDRHSRGVGGDSEKQAAHGWGATEGGAELADEQAGEAIAKTEAKEDGEAAEAAAEEAEPEDNSVSYADYLAQLEEKRAALNAATPEARKPDSKLDKKWANAKPISKEDEEDFVAGTGGKAKRERQRTQKQTIEIDQRYVEPTERAGGRGGFRGGRGRGDGAPRGDRGGFRGRGEGQRGRARGDRGPPRQSAPRNGGASASIQIEDQSAFPSLGA
ncbi:uncharacterized protein EAE98_001684 [Botrytis deweyae]|uniref:Hyaluronan/mRNA-binding protein domain-containing protein n=2 Tax=Botrytis TaxID=33196 RepID=A0A4Z1KCV9_9HELO|nr:uncharacterized protein EAE98_001684 [Botrytis deweyae]KAF7930213.1 hypothetical protein EAE99_004406 [Botrytis elliptica]KAF7937370.1 hypothetical protein EAE98_001684 [Botrytis deweyae]TGO79207.1 hypothetical protein BELL_0040g00110 [Botrytis elliptica]